MTKAKKTTMTKPEKAKRLKAAAPALYKALKDLLRSHDTKRSLPHDIWEAARKAIAKVDENPTPEGKEKK